MDMLTNSAFFGVSLTLAAYLAGAAIKKRFKKEVFNPILIAIIIIIAILLIFDIDYALYNNTAKYVSYLLTPATICLALPLYRQLALLKNNLPAILLGITSGVVAACGCVYLISVALSLNSTEYVTLLPKSITTAIGLPLSESLGGIGEITVAVIILTGIFSNLIATTALKIFRIKSPIAKGIAIGSSGHVIGTARAVEMGEVEGATSSLSIALSGVITVVTVQLIV